MKNYELINELAKLPAGAAVKISTSRNRDEIIIENEGTDDELFRFEGEIEEVSDATEEEITLDAW